MNLTGAANGKKRSAVYENPMDIELLHERARLVREVRTFFDSRQYLAVDTPLLAPDLIPESCLEVFETSWLPPGGSRQPPEKRWLIPSPEIWMKKLISRHRVNMYQICKCFRNSEPRGHHHNPEFTMLEYYTMNADYLDSLVLTEEFFAYLADITPPGIKDALRPPFLRITMEEAFRRWAGFSLEAATEGVALSARTALEKEAWRLGLDPHLDNVKDSAAVIILYDLIFIHAVEPALPKDRPLVILDYPAFVPCLSKSKGPAKQTKERWELYLDGIELANCYTEETDPAGVRRFFEEEAAEKELHGLVKHRIDGEYWKNFQQNGGEPPYSGVALGLDRLFMFLMDKQSIENVLSFLF